MTDMMTVPVRELIDQMRSQAHDAGEEGNILNALLLNGLANRLEQEANRADTAENDLSEMQQTFDLRWRSDMRAIKQWREGHPDRELRWPDHADLCVWLLEKLDAKT